MSAGKLTPDTMMSASRLPGLLGVSKYSTPNDELATSIHALDGLEPDPFSSEPSDWGNKFELHILSESVNRLRLDTFNVEHTEAMFHPDLPLCCSLDGSADGHGRVVKTDAEAGIFVIGQESIVLNGIGILEAKLTGQEAEDVPPLWRGTMQLQGQMLVTGAKWGAVCTLYKGTKLRIFLFARHEGTINIITKACLDFQRRLDKYKATKEIEYYPAFDSADANKLYPTVSEGASVKLSAAAEEMCQKIIQCKQDIAQLEKDIGFYETSIKELMKDTGKALAGKYKISWPVRNYQAQPERVVPATPARTVRQQTLTIKEIK